MKHKIGIILALVSVLLLAVFLTSCYQQTAPKTTTVTNQNAGQPDVEAQKILDQQAAQQAQQPAACGNGAVNEVEIAGYKFTPDTLEISRCDTVKWTNADSVPHAIAADNGEFSSDLLQKGDNYGYKFQTAGTFKYHCSVHPSMQGTITVK